MSSISKINAREILDSRGNPTLEVEIETTGGVIGKAMVPSGASTGKYEAVELRDGDPKRYRGKGVLKAVHNVNLILGPALKGMNVTSQEAIDARMIELDGTPNKAHLGANAILGISLAAAYTAANYTLQPLYKYLNRGEDMCLPVPMFNILNGGRHAANSTDFQEFMVMPTGAGSFSGALQMGAEVYHSLKAVLSHYKLGTTVGDEGGFAPSLPSNTTAIDIIIEAIEKAGYFPGKDCHVALDVAASEFYSENTYLLAQENKKLASRQLIDYYVKLINEYPVISIEDGLDEDDWEGWQKLNNKAGNNVQLVGDDLYVTNIDRLGKGIKSRASNSILIKLNQIGTVSETLAAIEMARKASFTAVVSHRSGETEDTTIADLAVAMGTGQIKTGAPCRSERTAKYNRLLKIEAELGPKAIYPGIRAFYNLRGEEDDKATRPPSGI
ncbi:MAG: phosphopyruvate hydratase [Dehalococcoidales bacterium]|jgi:enolase|nr:phosphopyruvate hydratase [Dehalococcoidales bacterium]MDD5605278.1 phosphopyruvate hydratase [Dehalococcoidales bacterium]MDX9986451.1 phosphopyruvate hydratase [Dehalococcoidales bacterium]NLE90541.1 phosphopyruvate hydratase [Dehalococcoidales bacterium]